jgi:diacylglycerol kinase (ATP)
MKPRTIINNTFKNTGDIAGSRTLDGLLGLKRGNGLRLFFIINPHASQVANLTPEAVSRGFQRMLQIMAPETACEFFVPESAEQMRTVLAQKLQEEAMDRVVVCGGDGTLTDILPVMIRHSGIPLAVIPMGTGNLLAVNLEIPFAIPQALAVTLSDKTRWVDIGRLQGANGEGEGSKKNTKEALFILNASVGIDAEIMHRTDQAMKRRWGWLAYFIKGIPMLPSASHADFRIVADGRTMTTRAVSLTISNAGSKVTGGIHLHPDVKPDDGLLHGTIFKPQTGWDYFYSFFQLLFSLLGKRRDVIRFFEARRIQIECNPPLRTQADGNVVGSTPVTIEVIEPRLQFCVPGGRLADLDWESSRQGAKIRSA